MYILLWYKIFIISNSNHLDTYFNQKLKSTHLYVYKPVWYDWWQDLDDFSKLLIYRPMMMTVDIWTNSISEIRSPYNVIFTQRVVQLLTIK